MNLCYNFKLEANDAIRLGMCMNGSFNNVMIKKEKSCGMEKKPNRPKFPNEKKYIVLLPSRDF